MCFCNFFRWCHFPAATAKQYKFSVEMLSCIIIVCQIIRIPVIAYEIKFITNQFALPESSQWINPVSYLTYPKFTAVYFCVNSIILGLVCLFLEALLLRSVNKKQLRGIQPWFVSTMLIFLIALICCVVTFSIYVVKPIDHNHKIDELLRIKNEAKGKKITPTTMPSNVTIFENQLDISKSTNVSIKVVEVNGLVFCVRLNSTSKVEVVQNSTKISESEKWVLIATPNGAKTKSHKSAGNLNGCEEWDETKNSFSTLHITPNEVLSLTFMIDIVRCLPQLFLVNRFVKLEKLHTVHMTPHTSWSALYVKHA